MIQRAGLAFQSESLDQSPFCRYLNLRLSSTCTCSSPFQLDVPDPQKDLIDPAVQGSRTVLESVINNQRTVKRVVMTSSVAGA